MIDITRDKHNQTAQLRAARRWQNTRDAFWFKMYDKELKAGDNEAALKCEMADVIENDGWIDGTVRRLETRFVKEIRLMLQGHAQKNVMLYAASLRSQKRRLLIEKLRRLEAQLESQSGG